MNDETFQGCSSSIIANLNNDSTESKFEFKYEEATSTTSTLSSSSSSSSSSSCTSSSSILKTRSGRCVKFNAFYMEKYARKRQQQNLMYQVKKALKKGVNERTKDDNDLLVNCQDLVKHVDICKQNRLIAAAHQEIIVDDLEMLEMKCKELSNAIKNSKICVFYTGAGISTSASIPDYRGPNGLWTLLERGIKIDLPDFSLVDPTYSHMALNSLIKLGLVKHVVSQNCDGLHVRSGIDREKLSELHGNCFIEFCSECHKEYVRLFDVTERSSFRKHVTGRYCKSCKSQQSANTTQNENERTESTTANQTEKTYQLRDSIIHFGEKLRNGSPYNWETARELVKKADLIVCFGTSLKVLKHYACLWPKKKSSASIYIVNIQWTPKDKLAKLKINGYCDQVMKMIVNNLQAFYPSLIINDYSIRADPILKLAVKLTDEELNTTTKQFITNRLLNNKTLKSDKKAKDSIKTEQQQPPTTLDGLNEDNIINNKCASNSNSWFTKSFKTRKSQKTNSKT